MTRCRLAPPGQHPTLQPPPPASLERATRSARGLNVSQLGGRGACAVAAFLCRRHALLQRVLPANVPVPSTRRRRLSRAHGRHRDALGLQAAGGRLSGRWCAAFHVHVCLQVHSPPRTAAGAGSVNRNECPRTCTPPGGALLRQTLAAVTSDDMEEEWDKALAALGTTTPSALLHTSSLSSHLLLLPHDSAGADDLPRPCDLQHPPHISGRRPELGSTKDQGMGAAAAAENNHASKEST
jgi:hypothetical protein